jgi:NAD(P)-dependent dehydrogenase (short-subunit alcohol dehydrogenase family)
MQAVLQYEVEPFGIRVIIIEPGIVESHFTMI